MIIDEATSSLDSTTEKLVQRGLREILKPDVGALVVAHRLSTVRHLCNRFIVLRTDDLRSTSSVLVNEENQPNAEAATKGESQIEATAQSFEELYEVSSIFRRLADDQGIVISSKDDSREMHLRV